METKKEKTVLIPQVALFNRALTIQKGALLDANSIAKNILEALLNPLSDKDVKIFGINDDGTDTPVKYNKPLTGLKNIIDTINLMTGFQPDEYFSFKMSINNNKIIYRFKGGKFSKSLNSIIKNALNYKLHSDYTKETGFIGYLDEEVNGNITKLVGLMIANFGLELKLHNVLAIAAMLDKLTPTQKLQVSDALSQLINSENAKNLINFEPLENIDYKNLDHESE